MKLRATFVKLTHVTSAIRCDDFSQSGYTLGCKECFAPLPCKVYLVSFIIKGIRLCGPLMHATPNQTVRAEPSVFERNPWIWWYFEHFAAKIDAIYTGAPYEPDGSK